MEAFFLLVVIIGSWWLLPSGARNHIRVHTYLRLFHNILTFRDDGGRRAYSILRTVPLADGKRWAVWTKRKGEGPTEYSYRKSAPGLDAPVSPATFEEFKEYRTKIGRPVPLEQGQT